MKTKNIYIDRDRHSEKINIILLSLSHDPKNKCFPLIYNEYLLFNKSSVKHKLGFIYGKTYHATVPDDMELRIFSRL